MNLNEITNDTKTSKVDHTNYKNYRYHSDKKSLSDHTDDELIARAYHIRDIFRGIKGPTRNLKKLELQTIMRELEHRKNFGAVKQIAKMYK